MINTFITSSLTTSDPHFLCYTHHQNTRIITFITSLLVILVFSTTAFHLLQLQACRSAHYLTACQYCESTRNITARSLLIHAIEDRCFPGGVASVPYHLCTHIISDFDRCPSPCLSNRPLAVISFLSLSGP